MAFTNRVRGELPFISCVAAASAGTATANNPKEGVTATAAGTTTFTFDTTGALTPAPTIRQGIIRIKATAAAAGGQITGIYITATDGTTTVHIYDKEEDFVAEDLPDIIVPFCLDINANSFAVQVKVATADYTLDIELAGCP